MSAKQRLIEYFLRNIGVDIDRDTLSKVADVHDWQRVIRSLRSDYGWEIETTKKGYKLISSEPIISDKHRDPINLKLRYAVLQRDGSMCQRCGRTLKDEIKLHIDHKIPVDMGGKTVLDNLWTLCDNCNLGKKNYFSDDEAELMKKVMGLNSGKQRLKVYFENKPNVIIEPTKLQIVSGIRDWERTLRYIRIEYNMNIEWVQQSEDYPEGGYIYHK